MRKVCEREYELKKRSLYIVDGFKVTLPFVNCFGLLGCMMNRAVYFTRDCLVGSQSVFAYGLVQAMEAAEEPLRNSLFI